MIGKIQRNEGDYGCTKQIVSLPSQPYLGQGEGNVEAGGKRGAPFSLKQVEKRGYRGKSTANKRHAANRDVKGRPGYERCLVHA